MKKYYHLFLTVGTFFSILAEIVNAQVIINEIHYNPDVKTEPVEFIELFNKSTNAISIGGWYFSEGIQYTFPAGTKIAPRGYVVVAQNPAALVTKYGYNGAYGPYSGGLSKYGERITLRDTSGNIVNQVEYGTSFPWPIVGEPPGYSIELIHPDLDNNLGGSWRPSVAGGNAPSGQTVFIQTNSVWKFFRGTNEPSAQAGLWRTLNFDDSDWETGPAPIGYDPSLQMPTQLNDMSGKYSCVYLRRTFVVSDPYAITTLYVDALYDDGFKVWINGANVLNVNISTNELPYTGTALLDKETSIYNTFAMPLAPSFLIPGTNIIAIQAANASLDNNPDFYIDIRLRAQSGVPLVGPTPGKVNAAYTTNAPPQIRQVKHTPEMPTSGVPVLITAKVTDPDGVASVLLEYQIVNPGNYIDILDPAYTNAANWVKVSMNDEGINGDATAGDSIYTATIPSTIQQHRRLIRYRITVTDNPGASVRVPYPEDPQPNFAYFVYDTVPPYSGAIQPGAAGTNGAVITVPGEEMGRLPVYHLIAKKSHVEYAMGWQTAGSSGGISNRYTGDIYFWPGTLIYDGKVYDHIHFRARGGVWRYSMVKNMWKFDMNRGHDFEPRDNWGKKLNTPWTKLNLGACIQQGDYDHRGEQGMFESVGFRLFQLAGIPAPHSVFVTFRVIDEANETDPTTQYEGDFWGLYLAVEQENGRFLEEHGLPDSNFYKMEGGTGTLNNIGPNGPTDKSDLNYILNNYTGASDAWWRTNWDLPEYYSYQAIVQAIHHYDISGNKNYFYYFNPTTRLWMIVPWDLDLSWAHNMYLSTGGGIDNIASRLFGATAVAGTGSQAGTSNMKLGGTRPLIEMEFKNRVREIRDLLFNSDQAYRLIDEYAALLRGPTNRPSVVDADRMMWDYNPKMANSAYTPNLNKAGQGRFYQFPRESSTNSALKGSFEATIRLMKNYVDIRSEYLDSLSADPLIPNRPTITYIGPNGFPVNKLTFRSSSFSTPSMTNSFGYIRWRIAEVTDTNLPAYNPSEPFKYEVETLWESGKITNFVSDITIPPDVVRVGRRYRVRVQHGDNYGRTSNWSLPIEFVATVPDNSTLLKQYLRITEIMYNPPPGGYEYIELKNISSDVTLDLAGVKFTQGVDFTFGLGVSLPPGGYIIVAAAPPDNNFAAFRAFYNIDSSVRIVGPFTSGKLDNAGEQIVLRTAAGGSDIVNFSYNNSRGWHLQAAGAGHSLVFNESFLYDQNNYANYSGSWMASAFIKGSPGSSEPLVSSPQLLINEIVVNTDTSNTNGSNNWIELYNPSDSPLILGAGWYLSDTPTLLTKWNIPPNTIVPAHGFVSFNQESGFNPANSGFSLNKSGGEVYLSFINGGATDRVVDVVRFKALSGNLSYGRYPDGSQYWATLSAQTPGRTNAAPIRSLMITEIFYHPQDFADGTDNSRDEFIEVFNASPEPIVLSQQWRIDGGVSFYFPSNITIAPREYALVVNFNPADPMQLEAFKSRFGITSTNLKVFGPYVGKLANDSERVALEYQTITDQLLSQTGWVIADEVIYSDRTPWPCGADGSGNSIQRVDIGSSGNNPQNWNAQMPTPGAERAPIPAGVPQIVSQPQSRIVPTNAAVSFQVSLCGTPPFTYQWRFNGVDLLGETNSTLNLYNVRLSDSGGYSVVVGNDAGMITSAVATLIVQLPPAIILNPQSLTATGYTAVVFNVSAEGTEPLFYQWLFNDFPISNATNSNLVLTNVDRANEGVYKVIVYNSAGSVVSSGASLTLRMPPKITIQPKPAIVRDGLTNIFTVQAIGDGTLYYQWLFNGQPIAGANSTNYVKTNVWETDEGDYSVLVTNQYGMALSESAHLTVLVRPYITMQPTPSVIFAPVGSDVNISISAGGTLPISYRWRKGSTTITNIILNSNTCVLTLKNVQLSDSGNYNCAITNIAGSATRLSSNAVVTVLYPPMITNQPRSVIATLGAEVEFSVGVSGSAPLTFQWWYNLTNRLENATNLTLTITNLHSGDIGLYSVTVSNPVGSVTSEVASLGVDGAPVITVQPTDIFARVGESVSFSVAATGNEPLRCQWLFNNLPIQGATSFVYRIDSVSYQNSGAYRAIITNASGYAISRESTLAVTNSTASLKIREIWLSGSEVVLKFEGLPQVEYVLEASQNLSLWIPIATNSAVDGLINFFDTAIPSKRFYRVRLR
ncbi:MAG: immunoglobulin domain-containing protein [Verrucomicrobiia bacterium]